MKLFVEPLLMLWRGRSLLLATTRSDLRARYAGSVLGLAWLLIYPLLFLGCYAAVYLYIFQVRFPQFSSKEYVAVIFCGLIPFLAFSESLGLGVGSVTSNANLIKNTLFPIDLVPVKAALMSQPLQIVGFVMLVVAAGLMHKLTHAVVLLPVVWVLQLMMTMGLLWILSSLNVFLRDLQNIVSVVVLMLMMVSPIAYTVDMVPAGVKPLLAFNPLYYVIISYQKIIILGEMPSWRFLGVYAAVSLGLFFIGYWFFSRLKRVFADNV